MNYIDHMTHDEAAVLAAVLLDGGNDVELMAAFWDYDFASQCAAGIADEIDGLHIAGEEVNVISMFEEMVESGDTDASQLELLNSIAQAVQPRARVLEIMRGAA